MHYPTLWVRFTSPREVHIDQGLTQLRRFCVTVGAASQISFMRNEDIHFLTMQIDNWICARF